MIQVAILSPMPALRAGLRALLAGDAELNIVGAGASLDDLADSLDQAGVIVATAGGLDLAGGGGLLPNQALLWVTDAPEAALVASLMEMELFAWGLLRADATAEALQAAVRALSEGLSVVPPETLRLAFGENRAGPRPALVAENEAEDGAPRDPLTAREQEVLLRLAQGLTNKQIALALEISEHTVKFHVSAIYSKLGVANRAEAVRKGARRGWVPL